MARVLIGNFKGPKGDKGDKGDRGPQGPQGPQGPVGLVNADAAIEFDDYSAEGVEIPTAEEALEKIVSGKSLKSLFSNIKAFLIGAGRTVPEVIGDKFSESKDFVTGDYAIRDNILYRFISDKAAGAWDETTVEPTTVAKELQEVNAKIEWKLLGTKSSPTHAVLQIPIPEDLDFSELCVVYESYNAGNYIFNIPRQALTPNKGIRQGFYSSANLTGFASLNVSATLIQMGSYNQNGVAATNVVMTVYYR